MNAKTIVAVAVATALFSGSALAVSGNPENPDASTKNWQLDELRQSVNNQFSDVNNRIDQIQTGGGFDASGIYNRLDKHDQQIGALDDAVSNLEEAHRYTHDLVKEMGDKVQNATDLAEGANAKAEEANKNALDAKDQAVKAQNTANKADYKADEALRVADEALYKADRANLDNHKQDRQIAELQDTKADRSELKEVAIKADSALAGSIENRNQIDAVKDNLANTDKQVIKNKNDIADLKNQNGALNDAVANAQDTANTASDKADKAQNTADKAAAGVNSVKNDMKVVSRDVANNSIRIQRNEERIDGAYAGIYDNRKNIDANRQAINRNSQEIQKLNKNFSDLKNTVDANRKRAAAGIAGVAAMANIPEVNSHQTFSLGVGVGGFDGQQAVAVGASARVNDNLTVKASVAANNEEVVWGAGAAFGW